MRLVAQEAQTGSGKLTDKEINSAVEEARKRRDAIIQGVNKLVSEAKQFIGDGKFSAANKKAAAAAAELEKLTGPYAEIQKRKLASFTAFLKSKWARNVNADAHRAYMKGKYKEAIFLAKTARKIDPVLQDNVSQFVKRCQEKIDAETFKEETSLLTIDPQNPIRKDERSEERRVGKECRSRWSP